MTGRRHASRALLLAVALLAGLAVPAHAGPVASYATPGCDAAPTWRVAYRMFWSDQAGRTLDREHRDAAWSSATSFADIVGTDSGCSVRVQIDLYDEAGPWTGRASADDVEFPADAGSFRAAGGYDGVFYRGPAPGAGGYAGITDYRDVWFPIAPDARPSAPNPLLVEHEWLHGVVEFYRGKISQGWPRDDVHGASNYPPHSGQVDRQYFAKMMTGTVAEPDGRTTGILPREWAYFGTPTRPLHAEPEVGVEFEDGEAIGSVPEDADAPAVLRLFDATGKLAGETPLRGRGRIAVPGSGRWRACVVLAEGTRYRAGEACETQTVTMRREVRLTLRKRKGGRVALTTRTPEALGRRAQARWVYYSGCSMANPGCNLRIVKRTVVLRRSQVLRMPRRARAGEGLYMEVRVPGFTHQGVRYVHQGSRAVQIKRG